MPEARYRMPDAGYFGERVKEYLSIGNENE